MIKGVVLAGGTGSPLAPLAVDTDTHLLPIGGRPMVYYAIECLARSGVQDVLVVTGKENAADFIDAFDDGRELGLRLRYAYQEKPNGTAQALALAEAFADGNPVVVMLGDNIVERAIGGHIWDYSRQSGGARVILAPVADPEPYGVAEFEAGCLVRIVEKPQVPPSDLVAIGIYMYDAVVFNVIRNLQHQSCGNVELTDVNNAYLSRGALECGMLEGWWVDAGTGADDYQAACMLVARDGANHDLDVGELRPAG